MPQNDFQLFIVKAVWQSSSFYDRSKVKPILRIPVVAKGRLHVNLHRLKISYRIIFWVVRMACCLGFLILVS
jgi:hypothetical protein